MTTTTTHETPILAPAALEALTLRLAAAERAGRAFLYTYEHLGVEEARAELRASFGADVLSSKLARAAGTRDALPSALADAKTVLAAPAVPARPGPAADFAELLSQERIATVTDELPYLRMKLGEVVVRATPVVPILEAAVRRYAAVMLDAGRALMAERHAREAEEISRMLSRQRGDLAALAALAAAWGV